MPQPQVLNWSIEETRLLVAEMSLLSQALQLPAEVQLLVQVLVLACDLPLPAEEQLVVQELQLAAGRDQEAAQQLALVVEEPFALVVEEQLPLVWALMVQEQHPLAVEEQLPLQVALAVEELELPAELALLVLTNLKAVHSPQPQVLLWLCLWQPDVWRGADHAGGQGQAGDTSDPDLEYQCSVHL